MTEETKESPSVYQLIGPSDDGNVNDLLAELNGKDSRQRLQALIAEWLRMENLVVLTAAGTSVTSGGKTMETLEREVLATVKVMPDLPPAISAVIEARAKETEASESQNRLGFEEWLSFLANANFIGSSQNSPFSGVNWRGTAHPTQENLSWFVTRIGRAIFAECALTLPDTGRSASTAADIAPHLAFLSKLVARDSNLGRAHLFTLNYDTLFEQALELLGIQYFDGFTGRADARFDPSVYGLDIYYPGEVAEGRVRRFDKFLHLYKLHGSIHWQVRGDELRARHPDLRDFVTYRSNDAAGKANKLIKLGEAIGLALDRGIEYLDRVRVVLVREQGALRVQHEAGRLHFLANGCRVDPMQRLAVANPIPLLPPVMTATLPSSFFMIIFLRCVGRARDRARVRVAPGRRRRRARWRS
jgi:hypothetical protein